MINNARAMLDDENSTAFRISRRVRQANLLPPEVDCARGLHGLLIEDEPQDLGECVNVEKRCSLCQTLIITTSWTKEAWNARRSR